MNNKINICVVIPTLGREWSMIYQTLSSIIPLLKERDALILVDQNESADSEAKRYFDERGEQFIYLKLTQKGLPNARNQGILNVPAHCDVVFFCDDDVIASKMLLEGHRKQYVRSEVGGVAGRVYRTDKKDEGILSGKVGRFRWWDANFIDNFDAKFSTETDSVYGCNMSFRKDLLFKINGFDVRFGGSAHLEESDVSLSVKTLGYKIIFSSEAALEHIYAPTGGCRLSKTSDWVYWYSHNYTLLYLKHFSFILSFIFFTERKLRILKWGIEERSFAPVFAGIKGLLKGALSYFFVKKPEMKKND